MLVSVLFGGFLILVLFIFEPLVWRPKGLRLKLHKQGIRGPPPSFLLGNIPAIKSIQHKGSAATRTTTAAPQEHHDDGDGGDVASISHEWPAKVFPFIEQWRKEYGPIFMYAVAHIQLLCITDIEVVKEIGVHKSLNLGTTTLTSRITGPLVGQGLLSSNGSLWLHQRKIIAPELYIEKVKGMMNLIVESTTSMLRSWENEIEIQGGIAEIRVDEHLKNLSADIISRACFQSNYHEGEEIFLKIRSLQKLLSKGLFGIPGFRWLPTTDNREIRRLEKEIESMILKLVKQRTEASYEKDLLQMILEGAKSSGHFNGISNKKFIVDNCKTIFFAGHETTAVATSWSLMLLAAHPDWQARVRAEVIEICGHNPPNADMLRSMKVLTMVVQEVLRLYSPAAFVSREAFETITFKNIVIPKGMVLQIPIPFLHQNPDLWGSDAHKFNPERFANGILEACQSPQAYMPFGTGPRICVGQHLAMTELKVILAMILSKFCFSVSPAYQHSPAFSLLTGPEHGILLHVRRV